jgi:tryptophan halogenase
VTPPRAIGVLGGGTAGYFAALAIKRRFPQLSVTLVESSNVPIIGVGEATTTLMPPFLHKQLGLSIHALDRVVRPTFKLGIRFEWGRPGDYHFNFPFGAGDPLLAHYLDGDLARQSLTSMLMDRDLAPIVRGPQGQVVSLLAQVKFAYHLDNAPFVGFLAAQARERGIEHIDFEVATCSRTDAGIAELIAADGRRLQFDLYVDASGFRAQLLERTLGVEFLSYASSLLCDRAVVATVPQHDGVIQPYTTAETMDAGWCWRIPTRGEDHRGYVYASAFIDDDAAAAELVRCNPGAHDLALVKFRSGRHRDWWSGNVVAVGNAYGFVEPLESTALHMVIIEVAYLLAGIEALATGDDPARFVAAANQAIAEHWDYLRWFLAIHYKFNERRDTAFWRAARADVDISGAAAYLAHVRSAGASLEQSQQFPPGDPGFGVNGMMTLLLGQTFTAPAPADLLDAAQWQQRVDERRRVASFALPQAEALALLGQDPALWGRFAEHPASWCERELIHVHAAASAGLRPRVSGPLGRVD